jgi:hypothetical protein
MRRVFCLLAFRLRRPQRLAQAEQSRTQHRRILKKSSSRSTHACLLNFHQRETYLFSKENENRSGNVRRPRKML